MNAATEIEYVPREIFDLERSNDRITLERRIDNLDAKLDLRVAEINGRIDVLNEKVDRIEATLSAKIDRVENTLSERIDKVENTLNEKIDRVETTLSVAINGTNTRLDTLTKHLEHIAQSQNFWLSVFGLILVVCTFVAPIVAPVIKSFFQ